MRRFTRAGGEARERERERAEQLLQLPRGARRRDLISASRVGFFNYTRDASVKTGSRIISTREGEIERERRQRDRDTCARAISEIIRGRRGICCLRPINCFVARCERYVSSA